MYASASVWLDILGLEKNCLFWIVVDTYKNKWINKQSINCGWETVKHIEIVSKKNN